ncbi:MAG TPA: DCC1-like thiol-disulfide oxidoreductase family protein [Nitrososphaerales archaeon]|nr:DCC1-like thiol-disulfide oxidoreductase family protein [Nitrososphaerales archaeon]
MKARGGLILAYDSACGPCSRFRALVGFFDAARRIEFMPIAEADEAGLLEGVPPEARYASFHLVRLSRSGGGAVASGSSAILPLVRALSPKAGRYAAGIPGIQWSLAFCYGALSRMHRWCAPGRGEG